MKQNLTSLNLFEIISDYFKQTKRLQFNLLRNAEFTLMRYLASFCIIGFSFLSFHVTAQTLQITATSDKADILTGETLVYTLKYKCASTTSNCTNVTLVATVPSGIFFPDQTIGLPSDILSYTKSPDGSTMTFVFKEPLTAGNTGIIQLTGQGSFGLKDGTPATMTANLLTGSSVGSTATVNTVIHSSDKFCPQFTYVGGLAIDNTTAYYSRLIFASNGYGTNGIGVQSPGPITFSQQFPAGTIIQSVILNVTDGNPTPVVPPNAYTIDNANAKVTVNLPASTMQIRSQYAPSIEIQVFVKYPSPTFSVGDNVSTSATVTYQPDGVASPITLTHGSTRNYTDGTTYSAPTTLNCTNYLVDSRPLVAPLTRVWATKLAGKSALKVGESSYYNLYFSNSGNTTLTNVVYEDIIPSSDVTVTSINRPNIYNLVGDEVIKFYVKTLNNPAYTEILPSNAYTYTPAFGDVVTAFKMTADKLPAGASTNGSPVTIYFNVNSNTTATSVQNCMTATASNSGLVLDPTASLCSTFNVLPLDPYSTLAIYKKITQYVNNQYGSFYGTPINPGTTFWNFIRLENQGGGQPLQNPIAMDLLPLGLDYNNDIQYVSGTPTADVTDIIPNFNGTGRTLIRLKWNSPMPAGTQYGFSIAVKVNALAPAGLASAYTEEQKLYSPYTTIGGIKNTAFFTGSSASKCAVPQYFTLSQFAAQDIYDLNSNGSFTDSLCYSSDHVGITSSAQMSSVKWVKGQCDSDYSKYPAFGQTMPGGLANYKLTVTNTGNVPTKEIQILDILPFVGDAGVIDPSGRLTQWRPNLVTPLQTPAGVTVYYSTSSNPCRTDYVSAGPAGCTPANWTTVLPQDPTTIQSIKLDFGTKVLNPGDQVELTWDMRAPVTGVTTGDIAWNSFGFKSTRADNNDPFLASEPFKVGIKLKDNVPANYGDFVWLDANKNGIQDSGEVGVDGVRVELHKDNGDGINDPKTDPVVAFTATANGGQYLFPSLPVGDYYAVFFLPAGYSTSPANATTDDKDSDGIPTICNGNRVTIVPLTTMASGETDLTWDQGIFPDKAAVGNYVWFDENQNNVQDESSANGINGVKVCLYTSTGTLVTTDTTSNDVYGRPGYYLFDQLDPGSYYVQFKPTPDKTYTTGSGTTGGTSSDETDSDVDPATGKTATFTLAAGQIDLTWDAGLIIQTGLYKLGNFVWSDPNNNGVVDTGESGMNNVTVNLYNDRNNDSKPQADEFVTTTITGTVGGIDGIYIFDRLPAGNYIVQVPDANLSGVLKDYISSTGNDPAADPDDNIENDDNGTAVAGCGIISKPVTLGSVAEPLDAGYTNYSVDFGFYKCNKPNYTASVTQPDCAGAKGNITLSTGTIGDKVGYSIGTTYTGNYASAVAISSLTGGVVVSNIAGSSADVAYTVRVYNGEEACYNDITFTIQALNCCTKPAAGNDQIACAGTSATLTGTSPTTGTWSAQAGNPVGATLSTTSAGVATVNFATTASGTYKFIYNIGSSCEDTMSVVVNAKPVIVDGSATICAGTNVDLTSKITDYVSLRNPIWTVSTAGGTVVSTATSVAPSTNTTYVLVAENAAGCKDTANVVVTVTAKPTVGSLVATQATCTGSIANSDAKIDVSGIVGGDKYSFGTTNAGFSYSSATAYTGGSITVENLANPTSSTIYYVRLYNGADSCFTDVQTTLSPVICITPCGSPNCLGITVKKN